MVTSANSVETTCNPGVPYVDNSPICVSFVYNIIRTICITVDHYSEFCACAVF